MFNAELHIRGHLVEESNGWPFWVPRDPPATTRMTICVANWLADTHDNAHVSCEQAILQGLERFRIAAAIQAQTLHASIQLDMYIQRVLAFGTGRLQKHA